MDQSKNTNRISGNRPSNVIPVRLDAAFFFERAVRYLDRHDLRRALKYFRKAVEYEPENAVNHCNLAGVLSELGAYEESNDILEKVILEIDPDMTECYFYMANNFANLGRYDLAEEYVTQYLEMEPDGEFAKEAAEMIDILVSDFGGGHVFRRRQALQQQKQDTEQDQARRLLEEGQFVEATKLVEDVVKKSPEETAPRNNLSLAYYYMGDMSKAMDEVEAVLDQDPANVHALCNLAVYYHDLGRQEPYDKILDTLKKIRPFTFEHAFKLASTMGLLGEHKIAKRLFQYLIRWIDRPEPSLLHCYAAALANCGHLEKAKRVWLDIEAIDSGEDIARYFIRQIDAALEKGETSASVSYQYHIPFHEQYRRMQEYVEKGKGYNMWQADDFIRSSVFWTLKHGDVQAKLQVLKIMEIFPDREGVEALKELAESESESDIVKQQAAAALRQVQSLTERMFPGGAKKRKILRHVNELNEFYDACDAVLEMVVTELENLDPKVAQRAESMWRQFQKSVEVAPPRMNKPEGWAAALECAALYASRLDYTQKEIAEKYGVSQSNVSAKFREIMDICFLRCEI